MSATAAKDNIWTLLKGDPTERIIDRFVRCLPPAESSPSASQSVAGELERLSELHQQGRLSDEEFEAAKRKALGQAARGPARVDRAPTWVRPLG